MDLLVQWASPVAADQAHEEAGRAIHSLFHLTLLTLASCTSQMLGYSGCLS